MSLTLPGKPAFHAMVLDSLEEQIAVIDLEGTIIYVNRAWTDFGTRNGLSGATSGAGTNYLNVCNVSLSGGDNLAGKAQQGLLDVLSGKRTSFYFEYPCHSSAEQRWFMMRVTPLQGASISCFVISHHNITQRKLAEEQIEHLSLHDPLTGLSNRRHFNQFLDIEWRRCFRNQMPISFIMFDLDHFKDYNDEMGHIAGDNCLAQAGKCLQEFSNRPGDLAVRYGGEEFGLLLAGIKLDESLILADAARQRIYELDIRYLGTRRITMSAGVASAIPDEKQTKESLIRDVDKALYVAKQRGRNQIAQTQSLNSME